MRRLAAALADTLAHTPISTSSSSIRGLVCSAVRAYSNAAAGTLLRRLSPFISLHASYFLSHTHTPYAYLHTEDTVLIAQLRPESGSRSAARLRKQGQTPGTLFSLPGEQTLLVSFDTKEISNRLHKLGRTGWACHVFSIQIQDTSPTATATTTPTTPTTTNSPFPALGRQVHIDAVTDEIENVTFIHCPPDRRVKVNVPLHVYGEESCPGLKAGGRINWISRTIPIIASGHAVPSKFEVDVSALDINHKLSFEDLRVPEGARLAVKNPSLPILKIMKK